MDIIISLVGIIILFPVFIIISILIKVDSKGTVFFKQDRRTKNGEIFKIYKFRSMKMNTEKIGTGLFNFENDLRVTKLGKFLRKSSLDELPQLINVLKGDLSLVGPRPCVAYELGDFDTLNKKYKKRFKVKGGITGLAQIKGRNENSWEEKIFYDNKYIEKFEKQGVILDVKIIILTFFKIIKSKDIYEVKISEELTDELAAKEAEEEVIRLAHLLDE